MSEGVEWWDFASMLCEKLGLSPDEVERLEFVVDAKNPGVVKVEATCLTFDAGGDIVFDGVSKEFVKSVAGYTYHLDEYVPAKRGARERNIAIAAWVSSAVIGLVGLLMVLVYHDWDGAWGVGMALGMALLGREVYAGRA